jgi:putative cell wall-binding protein
MRFAAVLAVWGMAAGGLWAVSPVVAPAASAAVQEDQVFDLVNQQRASAGRAPLLRDGSLESAAEEWASHLSTTGTFEHSTSDWRTARIPAGWNSQGENIAQGYSSATEVMNGWMNSTGHRENILRGSFTRIGIGYVESGNYWVQIFAGYPGDSAPALTQTPVPVISGTPAIGQTLTAQVGTWQPAPVAVSVQWNRDGAPIAGATAASYVVGYMDAGRRLSVTTIGSKTGYRSTTMTSAQTTEVQTDRITERVAGADRYAVSVAIADKAYPFTADIVFVATGENYPDALSAGPAAARLGGPLLLTPGQSLPESVRQKIVALDPDTIVVVGGPNAVAESVFDELAALQPDTRRIGGPDRFAVSRNLLAFAFGGSSSPTQTFIVTGNNFPDALSASAAAGAVGAPLLLVDGLQDRVSTETIAALSAVRTTGITIVGGPATIRSGIETSLRAQWGQTVRISGEDRYSTSAAVMAQAYPGTSPVAMIATGENYPDALAGSAWAGVARIPLFIVPSGCLPAGTLAEIYRLGAHNITLLGGPVALRPSAEKMTACG